MLFKAQAWLPAPNKGNASGATVVQPKHVPEKASLIQRLTALHNYNGLAKPALLWAAGQLLMKMGLQEAVVKVYLFLFKLNLHVYIKLQC